LGITPFDFSYDVVHSKTRMIRNYTLTNA